MKGICNLFLPGLFLILIACDDDNNTPGKKVQETFNSRYPVAERIEWENKGGCEVVEFYVNGLGMEAWFTPDGLWVKTETDIRYNMLPDPVKVSFSTGEYTGWRVEDVDKIEYPESMTEYVLDVESGKSDIDLYYRESGELIKVVND